MINDSSIKDNFSRGKVADFLTKNIQAGSKLSFVSAYFTIYAYEAIKQELESIDHLDFLFGEPTFISQIDPNTQAKEFKIEDSSKTISLNNRLDQKRIARDCATWLSEKASVRSMIKPNFLHGKLYHIINTNNTEHALLGSSNFTKNGIGYGSQPNIELNLELNDRRDVSDLRDWFQEIWDSEHVEDVKEQVINYLNKLYADNSPELIYFKTLYHIFEKFLDEQLKGGLLNESIGFFDTQIWNMLYDFQKDGVKGAINKILSYNGCIIADSVGLGKTFEALAVIKYFLLLNYRILVLCPKKLRKNWTQFRADVSDQYNFLAIDKLEFTVLSHTDLSRSTGEADGKDLSTLSWPNYDLIIIDESHNFRNYSKGKTDDKGEFRQSRYNKLLEDVIKSGSPTKVLLLSATPVNNDLKDLRNQIYLITKEKNDALLESTGIKNIGETLRVAQAQFSSWAKNRQKSFLSHTLLYEKLDSSFFKLLDTMSISRSRKHILNYYDIDKIGKFSKRLKPISLSPDIDLLKLFPTYDKLNTEIMQFKLSLYNPSKYVKDEYKDIYRKKTSSRMLAFEQETREHFLIGMMKVNFLKRLESSIESFEITLDRTINKIINLEAKIDNFDTNQAESLNIDTDEFIEDVEKEEDDDVNEAAEMWQVGSKLKFELAHLKLDEWKDDLKKDKDQLLYIHNSAITVTPERDEKLQKLKELIISKIFKPLNQLPNLDSEGKSPNKKVLIFTAFADTATYLYDNLNQWLSDEFGIHSALVSGGNSSNKSTFNPHSFLQQTEFNNILSNFSPRSKNRKLMKAMPQVGEIDVLFATDCISEGQNLQDCDYLINYDIHWNPVRIIQRFGRIDRLGSTNDQIQLVNFWPTDDLNKYINLRDRVEARMALVDLTASADDNLLKKEEIKDVITDEWKYREKQLLRLKDEVLDLEDMDDNISLTDFTLDDFRIELSNFLENNKDLLRNMPLGLYAIVPTPDGAFDGEEQKDLFETTQKIIKPGVIFCLKQKKFSEDNEVVNSLNPHFLVYIRDDGDVRFNFTNAKQILEVYRLLCQGKEKPYKELCDLFDTETNNGSDMSKYNDLIQKAIKQIVRVFKKRNFSKLTNSRDAKIIPKSQSVDDMDDFELITWLIIK